MESDFVTQEIDEVFDLFPELADHDVYEDDEIVRWLKCNTFCIRLANRKVMYRLF
jgi:hypothetical protein